MLIQKIEAFFAGLEAMGLNLPMVVLVPLIMVLTIAGTVILVKSIQWIICLVFRDRGRKFVDGFTDWTSHVEEYTKNVGERTKHVDEHTKNL